MLLYNLKIHLFNLDAFALCFFWIIKAPEQRLDVTSWIELNSLHDKQINMLDSSHHWVGLCHPSGEQSTSQRGPHNG